VEAAKALGGSFQLVTLAPKTAREMTQTTRRKVHAVETQIRAAVHT